MGGEHFMWRLGAPLTAVLFGCLLWALPARATVVHRYKSTFGSEGSGPGQFKAPSGLAVNASTGLQPGAGDIYVAATGEQKSTVCLGTYSEPAPSEGNLCVYVAREEGVSKEEAANEYLLHYKWGIVISDWPDIEEPAPDSDTRYGFGVRFLDTEGVAKVGGTWAVTG